MYALLSATHSITTDLVAPSLATGAQALTSAVLGVALTVCTRTLLVLKYALSKAARRATPSRIKRDIVEIESSGATYVERGTHVTISCKRSDSTSVEN